MYNEFQQRLAYLGFTITEEQYNLFLASGLDDEAIESIAADIAAGFPLEEVWP
jgi:hypothetical protein